MGGRALVGLALLFGVEAGCGGAQPSIPQPASPSSSVAANAVPAAHANRLSPDAVPVDVRLAKVDADLETPYDDVPLVVVRGFHIWLDGREVADQTGLTEASRTLEFEVVNIAGLKEALVAKREAWKVSHGDARFPGSIALAFDGLDDLRIVKSVFFTAASAEFRHERFILLGKDNRMGTLSVSAPVPVPIDRAGTPTEYLVVQVDNGGALAFWQKRGEPREASLGASAALGSIVRSEWGAHGLHRLPSDPANDQAFLFADKAVAFSAFATALAALGSVSKDRDFAGRHERAPALDVTFMLEARPLHPELIKPPVAGLGPSQVNGRLPPELIQTTVRGNFGAMRKCYEEGLRRDRNLAGKVETKFVIARDGRVSSSAPTEGTTLKDAAVASCVASEFGKLTFPAPEGGIITVVYPIIFNPGD